MSEPNAAHALAEDNLLTSFPIALQGDKSVMALAGITARLLARRPEEIGRLRIYPVIDQLPEKLLDILAYDFKVDWWNPNYTLEEKRRTLADSWRVHKMLGTKAAVEMAIRAIYPKTDVLEWFDYEGGKPYHFKLNIDLTDTFGDETRPWAVLERVNYYKSLRSHLEEIVFVMHATPTTLHVGGGVGAETWIGVPLAEDTYDFRDTLHMGGGAGAEAWIGVPSAEDAFDFRNALHMGGDVGARVETGVPAAADNLRFQDTLRTGGVFSGRACVPVPDDAVQPTATTILRTGGVCTILSNSNLLKED